MGWHSGFRLLTSRLRMMLQVETRVDQAYTHDSAQRVQAEDHLGNVASLKEISSLENLLVGDSILLNGLLEPGNKKEYMIETWME